MHSRLLDLRGDERAAARRSPAEVVARLEAANSARRQASGDRSAAAQGALEGRELERARGAMDARLT